MNKQLRYSDEELKFIKDVFSGDEKLLRVIQRAMFREDLSKDDIIALSTISGNKFFSDLLEKEFRPKLNTHTSFLQNVDLWSSINFGDKSLSEQIIGIKIRKVLIDMVDMGMDNIHNPKPKGSKDIVEFNVDSDLSMIDEAEFVAVKARAEYIQHVETRLQVLSIIAGSKEETTEQQKRRLMQNSSK